MSRSRFHSNLSLLPKLKEQKPKWKRWEVSNAETGCSNLQKKKHAKRVKVDEDDSDIGELFKFGPVDEIPSSNNESLRNHSVMSSSMCLDSCQSSNCIFQ